MAMSDPMNDADMIRFLAGLAGWKPDDCHCGYLECSWQGFFKRGNEVGRLDYPHSLDAIARDLLPLLREKGWLYALTWYPDSKRHEFIIHEPGTVPSVVYEDPDPARAAFEAIYEAFKGGEG